MAQLIIRPRMDGITVKHSAYGGSTRLYDKINEEVSDGDSTYVYETISSSSAGSQLVSFVMLVPSSVGSAFLPKNFKRFTSFKVYFKARISTSTYSNLSIRQAGISIGINDTGYSNNKQLFTLSNSYNEYSFDATAALDSLNNAIANGNFKSIAAGLITYGSLSNSAKSSTTVQIRITHMYIVLEYDENESEERTKLWINVKSNIVSVKKLYKKISGHYEEYDPRNLNQPNVVYRKIN